MISVFIPHSDAREDHERAAAGAGLRTVSIAQSGSLAACGGAFGGD
jgi:hypothetical protein